MVTTESGAGSASASGPVSGAASGSASAAGWNARPAAITDDILARNDVLTARLRELGAALAAAGTDCKQATAALVAATPAITAALTAVRADGLDDDEAANHWLYAHNAAVLAPGGDPFLAAGEHCKRDPAFVTAIEAIGLFGTPQ